MVYEDEGESEGRRESVCCCFESDDLVVEGPAGLVEAPWLGVQRLAEDRLEAGLGTPAQSINAEKGRKETSAKVWRMSG